MTKTNRRASSGAEFRKRREEGVLIHLPSGMKVYLRSVGFDLLIKTGRVPDSLTPLVIEALEGTAGAKDERPRTLDDALQSVEFINTVCQLAVVYPAIVADPKTDDEMTIDDLEFGDKVHIMQVLYAPLRDLERFRPQLTGDVEPVGSE